MDRKDFLKSCGFAGFGACFLTGSLGAAAQAVSAETEGTPCDKKQEFALKWVKRFFDVFDESLDVKTRNEIMERSGKACFLGSIQGRQIAPIEVDKLIDAINKSTGEIAATRDGNVIDFRYVSNENGLKVADGYCLCPLVESGPEGLSGTYCRCSVGYVREMFKTYTGRDNDVDLVESLKLGGKTCRFRITLKS